MPILIELRESRYCPVIRCDHCGELIEQADARYRWAIDDQAAPATGSLLYLHNRCTHAYEIAHQERAISMSEGLALLPIRLAANAGIDLREAERQLQRLADAGL